MSAVPFIKFYPSDWLSDERLRLVSVGARGLWIDLICLMAKNDRRGFLTVNGGDKGRVNPTLAQLAKLTALTEVELPPLLEELKQAGVCSVEAETGIIFSRRLVRDNEAYEQAVKFGSKGGNPSLKKRLSRRVNPPLNPTQQPPLGSGFSSSNSGSEGVQGKPKSDALPPSLDTPAFRETWARWKEIRHQGTKPKTPWDEFFHEQLQWLARFPVGEACEVIRQSIRNGWQGLFELKSNGQRPAPQAEFQLPANMR